jgi:hypothetical protein
MLSSLSVLYDFQRQLDYTGDQLHSLFNYKTADLVGDSIFAFIGKMDVKTDHMVDIEDVKENDFIYSPKALNFVIEIFNINIETAVLYQRAFMQICVDVIRDMLMECSTVAFIVKLKGDDILVRSLDMTEYKKLSVSIATVSHVSGLIHAGINIDTDDKIPVPAIGLTNLFVGAGINEFAIRVLEKFSEYHSAIKYASVKVRGV